MKDLTLEQLEKLVLETEKTTAKESTTLSLASVDGPIEVSGYAEL